MKNNGERIKQIIMNFCSSKVEFAKRVGASPQTINNWINRDNAKNVLKKVIDAFPEVNEDWLITGHGNMLKQGDVIIGENNGNFTKSNSGQMINISLPENGSQKIIKPDGTVEVHSIGKNIDNSNNTDKFIELLKKKDEQIDRLITLLENK